MVPPFPATTAQPNPPNKGNPAAMATTPNKVAAKRDAEEAKTTPKRSAIPDSAPRPQDHKSAKADVVSDGQEITFEYGGKTYTLIENAFEEAQDVDFLEQLQDGNLIGPMRTLLGFEQWFELKQALRPDIGTLKQETLRPAFEAAMKALKAKNS